MTTKLHTCTFHLPNSHLAICTCINFASILYHMTLILFSSSHPAYGYIPIDSQIKRNHIHVMVSLYLHACHTGWFFLPIQVTGRVLHLPPLLLSLPLTPYPCRLMQIIHIWTSADTMHANFTFVLKIKCHMHVFALCSQRSFSSVIHNILYEYPILQPTVSDVSPPS